MPFGLHAPVDVAASDHDGHLYPAAGHGHDLLGILVQRSLSDAVGLVAHEAFAGELEEDALEFPFGAMAVLMGRENRGIAKKKGGRSPFSHGGPVLDQTQASGA
jgi:hypothetical protein